MLDAFNGWAIRGRYAPGSGRKVAVEIEQWHGSPYTGRWTQDCDDSPFYQLLTTQEARKLIRRLIKAIETAEGLRSASRLVRKGR